MREWANQNINEPTLNVARVPKKRTLSKAILTNEIGRHVPRSTREERQSKVDALVAIQAAGER